jgi:hypothetical protein
VGKKERLAGGFVGGVYLKMKEKDEDNNDESARRERVREAAHQSLLPRNCETLH